jgi:ATP-dependent RNA circularization protein (DNA/RNA ligase family)
MIMDFLKFPRTPHLFVVPGLNIRDDKLLGKSEAELFFNNPIVLEEKVDGANIGISFSESGILQLQNRGNYLSNNDHPQFSLIWNWAYSRLELLQQYISSDFVVFGEWCYAKHSIYYTSLPDWFLGFDVFDKKNKVFLNSELRNRLLKMVNIEIIPVLGKGNYSEIDLEKLLMNSKSKFYSGPVEGIYIRYEDSEKLLKRAKIVRGNFIQDIDTHWSNKKMTINKLKLYENDHRTF